MPLMGVDQQHALSRHLGDRRRAGRPGRLPAGAAVRHPSVDRPAFGPLIFMICVLGGLGNMIGGFVAAFIISQFISVGGYLRHTEMGLRDRLPVLHRDDLRPAARDVRAMNARARRARRLGSLILVRRCRSSLPRLLPAPADPDPALVLHLHRLVADGPLRPRLARPRRLHRHRRLRHGAALELLRRSRRGSAFRSAWRCRRCSACWSAIPASASSSATTSRW